MLLDGGTGSELHRRGVATDPVAWSAPAALAHADTLAEIHADYIRAGADVITTNTFGTTRFVLDAAGLGRHYESINRAAVEAAQHARSSAGREVAIAGSLSCLPPGFDPGGYPQPDVERADYLALASLLAELGVDLLVLEMMEETVHARLACEAARDVGLPFWLGVSARIGSDGRTPVAYDFPDVPLADVLDALLGFGPAVVNIMHTRPESVVPAIELVAAHWGGVLGAYPEVAHVHSAAPAQDPDPGLADWIDHAERWLAAGVQVIGGCCGTTPGHIAALRRLVDAPGRTPA